MAQILSFRTPEFRSNDVAERRDGASAEVILFPGVRYERWRDEGAAAGGTERRRDRDVLELAE
jgi:hypothetical protein